MPSISLCMIVKNEEDTLARCLSSVADFVDEIIIVDTGSTDRTKEIARPFTSDIYDFVWIDDFAAARNYAFSQATMEYILWLDADDFLRERDRSKLAELKDTLDPSVDSVTMEYHLAHDEYGNVTVKNRRNRLVKRSNSFRWIGRVHEYLEVWGHIINSDVAITHASMHHDRNRNIAIYENALQAGETFTPRDLYYYANELQDHARYEEAIQYYEQFLETGQGWIEDNLSACGKMADCHHALGNEQLELESAIRSLQYAAPRAEICCRLGFYFMQKSEWQSSIFWYKIAIALNPSDDMLGLSNTACSTWLPHLQLCVCYDRIGDHHLASAHNELAAQYRPEDERVLHNRAYFESIFSSLDTPITSEAAH